MRLQATVSVLLAAAALPATLRGQVSQRPTRLAVQSCHVADSLLGRSGSVLSERIMVVPMDGQAHLFTQPGSPNTHRTGVADVGLMADIPGDSANAPAVAIVLKVVSPAARSIDERQLVLFADSVRLDLGSLTAEAQNWPGAVGVVENMVATIPVYELRLLAAATRITGSVGSLAFELSDRQRSDFETFWVALMCRGAAPRS